jgi:Tol biopolymer transport system component
MTRNSATLLTDRSPQANFEPAWSPDGTRIAFKRSRGDRPAGGSRAAQGTVDLVVRTVATGEEKVYTRGFIATAPIIWSRDGTRLLTAAPATPGRFPLRHVTLDLATGESTASATPLAVGTFAEGRGVRGALAADGKTMYVRDWTEADNLASIVAYDTSSGAKRAIWSRKVPDSRLVSEPALSPDGRSLAFFVLDESYQGRLARVAVDGTGYREIATNLPRPSSPRWAQGGRTIVFIDRAGGGFRLMRVSSAGGQAPIFTGFSTPDEFSFDISPDDSQLVFSERFSNELWAIDNVSRLWTRGR